MAMACKTLCYVECASSNELSVRTFTQPRLSQGAYSCSFSNNIKSRMYRSTFKTGRARDALVSHTQDPASRALQETFQDSSTSQQLQVSVEDHAGDTRNGLHVDDNGNQSTNSSFQEDSEADFPLTSLSHPYTVHSRGDSTTACSSVSLLNVSQENTNVEIENEKSTGIQLREEEEEWPKDFPGAKGALVKPLTEESLAYFPEGYLDTVTSIERLDWVTIVPTRMLPRGDRLVLEHNGEKVMLFWFEGRIYALENRSSAAPMFEEGFAKSTISKDGIITCPITGSKYDIRTGATVEWLPRISFLERLVTPPLSDTTVYAVKASPGHIFIHTKPLLVGGYYPLAESTGNRIWDGPDYEVCMRWLP
ncbi:hypothetical protein KP509_32G073500 [Ceratopteris richardii]|uniref:Rieske-like [2Fe-2S] domain-containing protein n=1 Tax=Ceratopteris richardii TaxID=49495 RepID=A0A8T2QVX7_CERRI|nr:hypothetical protein KP509_32G073500 [Ceratopteris richardii]